MPAPTRVTDVEQFWTAPPSERSNRCAYWRSRIANGWQPNRRIRAMGYYERAAYFGVYIWELLNEIDPMIEFYRQSVISTVA